MKIFFSLLCCLAMLGSNAQITMAETAEWTTIGQLKPLGSLKAKMEYRVSGNDTIYFLFVKDFTKREEPHYFGVKFRSTDNTFSKLYELLKSFFLDENRGKNYTKTFRLGEDMVNLQHQLLVTGKGVRFTTREGYINFSEKDIDKLFGMR